MMHACICTRCTAHPPPPPAAAFSPSPSPLPPLDPGEGVARILLGFAAHAEQRGPAFVAHAARVSEPPAEGERDHTAPPIGRRRASGLARRLARGRHAVGSGAAKASPRRPLLVGARTRRRFRRRFGLPLCGRRHLRTAWPPRRCAPGLLRLRADNWGQARRLLGRCRRPRSSWRPLRGSRSRAGAPPKGSSCKPVEMGGAGGHPVRGKPPCLPVRSGRKRTSISARIFASLASNTPRCASACGAKATACLHILPLRSRTRRAHRRTCRSAPLLHRRGGRRRRRPARPRGAAWPMRRALRSTALRRPLGRARARAT